MDERQTEMKQAQQRLNQLTLRLNNLYQEMGKELEQMVCKRQKEANALYDQIISVKKELHTLRGDVQCPYCMSYSPKTNSCCSYCKKTF